MRQSEEKKCLLCGKDLVEASEYYDTKQGNQVDGVRVDCERCGRYEITEATQHNLDTTQKLRLSAYSRRANRKDFLQILPVEVDSLLASLPEYCPPERLDNLLQLLAEMSPGLGKFSTFDQARDYPLLIADGPSEVQYLMQELTERGYVGASHNVGPGPRFAVKLRGWDRLAEIKKEGRASMRAFVAMWFDASMDRVYSGAIAPAIRDAGFDPLRIDMHQHVNRIDDEIIGQIRRCRFMVADFTGQRHGVYFEAGMMLGIGRTVIWMCSKEELNKKENGLHFDVRQFNFIVYEGIADARKRLYDRILAIEGEGASATSNPAVGQTQ